MRLLVLGCILLAGQLNSLQPRPVVHLQPNKATIEVSFDGSVLELINAPAILHLPAFPPKRNAHGALWSVEVKNFGPRPVMISGDKTHFETVLAAGQTTNILSNGTAYFVAR